MDGTKNERLDRPVGQSLNNKMTPTRPSRTSITRKAKFAMLLICMCTPRIMGQRHQHPRLWPPPNVEPCVIQCPAQHVQMTGNRSSGAETSQWGPQPILDFMSNSQLQTSAPPLRPMTLAINVAATSGITTLVTSVTSVAGSTKSQEKSFSSLATSMVAVSGGGRRLVCDTIFQVVVTLSCTCIALFHKT